MANAGASLLALVLEAMFWGVVGTLLLLVAAAFFLLRGLFWVLRGCPRRR